VKPLYSATAALTTISIILLPVTAGASDDWWKPFAWSAGICLGIGICIVLIAGGMEDLFGEEGIIERREDEVVSMAFAHPGDAALFSRYAFALDVRAESENMRAGDGFNLVGGRLWHLGICAEGIEVRF